MLTYPLQLRGKTPLYQYLYQCIRADILEGRIPSGERLPSKRALAQHLQISVLTVENAYAQLLVEGYLTSRPGSGYYVNRLETHPPHTAVPDMSKVQPEPPPRLYYADLRCNRIGMRHFPFSVWARLMREVVTDRDERLLRAVPAAGVWELRQEISTYLLHFRGMQVNPQQIVIAAGTELLYAQLLPLLSPSVGGLVCGVEEMGYERLPQTLNRCGCTWRPLPLDAEGIALEAVKCSGCHLIHLSPEHHFPSGTVTSIARRQQLLHWAAEDPNRYLIEDDFDSEFGHTHKPIPALFSMDRQGKVIYMNTFSKTLVPSIRISYMVLPPALAERFSAVHKRDYNTVSAFEQHTLARFMRQGYYERHLSRMRNYYQKQREQLLSALKNSISPSRAEIMQGEAGTHFMLHLHTDMPDSEITARLLEQDIHVAALSEYCRTESTRRANKHILVINYSILREQRIEETARRIQSVLEDL